MKRPFAGPLDGGAQNTEPTGIIGAGSALTILAVTVGLPNWLAFNSVAHAAAFASAFDRHFGFSRSPR